MSLSKINCLYRLLSVLKPEILNNGKKLHFYTVKPLNSGHLRVLKYLSVIKWCSLLRGSLTKIIKFRTKHFVRDWRHVRYLGYPLLGGFTVLRIDGVSNLICFITTNNFCVQQWWFELFVRLIWVLWTLFKWEMLN